MTLVRTRWAAIGAAVAVTLGGGGIAMVSATSPADAVTFVPITPCRVIDTRPADQFNVGPRNTPVGAEEEHSVTATGNAGKCTEVPTSATAVSLNVTALNATLPTFLAVYATGEATPDASSLNPQPGAPPTPNAVTTELSAGGAFTIFNKQGSVDVLADINGYYVDHHHDDRYYTKDEMPDILAFAVGDSFIGNTELTGDLESVVSIAVQAKASGTVIVNSYANVFHPTAGSDVFCFIVLPGENPVSLGTNIPGAQIFESEGPNSNDGTIAGTRSFNVAADSVSLIDLRCAENGGDGGRIFQADLNAVFIPTASDL